jgi:hypothetical protein
MSFKTFLLFPCLYSQGSMALSRVIYFNKTMLWIFQTNIVAALVNLKLDEDFVDVTLSCEGKSIKAHRVILSACSDYFRDIFRVSIFIEV